MTSGDGPATSRRPTVEERAARRADLERPDRDRYDSLLRHLRAGREMALEPRRRRTFGLDIHPIAGRLIVVTLVVAALWIAAITVTDLIRERVVDTWDGPDDSVRSGIVLEGCPAIRFPEDVYLPSWITYEGRTFRWAARSVPIGDVSIGTTYLPTGYTHDDLVLYRVAVAGQVGERMMIRQGEAQAGAVYIESSCG